MLANTLAFVFNTVPRFHPDPPFCCFFSSLSNDSFVLLYGDDGLPDERGRLGKDGGSDGRPRVSQPNDRRWLSS